MLWFLLTVSDLASENDLDIWAANEKLKQWLTLPLMDSFQKACLFQSLGQLKRTLVTGQIKSGDHICNGYLLGFSNP